MSKKWQKIVISGICILLAVLMALSLILTVIPLGRGQVPTAVTERIEELDLRDYEFAS